MKSSFSNPKGNCIDVTEADGFIYLVETALPRRGTEYIVVTNKANFKAFIDGVKAGEFDHFVEGL